MEIKMEFAPVKGAEIPLYKLGGISLTAQKLYIDTPYGKYVALGQVVYGEAFRVDEIRRLP